MRRTIIILLCLALKMTAVIAATPLVDLASHLVTSDPESLLAAVRLLISEVSELKKENSSLRKDVDESRSEIVTLNESNEALTERFNALQQQYKKRPSATSSWSSKLRGSSNDDTVRESPYQTRIEALENKLACVSTGSNAFDIFFEGCNVHVRDGSGSTEGSGTGEQSGRGNIIIGYNEDPDEDDEVPEICSNSSASDLIDCQRNGGVWGLGIQTGIHNLIIGAGHSFTQHSGLVVGTNNAITGIAAAVMGGKSNVASGDYSTVAGGTDNKASGKTSAVLGGFENTASGADSFVGGGSYNSASGSIATVVGGENNRAQGDVSFISGGNLNRATGEYACTTSSFSVTAAGKETGVAGGRDVVAAIDETMIAGHMFGMKNADPKQVSFYIEQ